MIVTSCPINSLLDVLLVELSDMKEWLLGIIEKDPVEENVARATQTCNLIAQLSQNYRKEDDLG